MGKRQRQREQRRAEARKQRDADSASRTVPRIFAAIVTLVLGATIAGIGVMLALVHQTESLPDLVQDVGPDIRVFADGDPFLAVTAHLDARQAPSAILTIWSGEVDEDQPVRHVWLIISDLLNFEVQPAPGLTFHDVAETGDGIVSLTPAESQGSHKKLAVSLELSAARPQVSVVIASEAPSFLHGAGLVVTPMPSIEVGLRGGMQVVDSDALAAAISAGDAAAMKLFRAATIDGVDVYPPLLDIEATASPYDLLNPETMAADVLLPQPTRYSPLGWSVTTAFRPYLQWRDLEWETGQERQSVVAAVLIGLGSGLFLAPFAVLFEVERRRRKDRRA